MNCLVEMDYKWMNSTIARFKQTYPNLIKRGTSYEPYYKNSMIVRIPTVGKLIYDKIDNKVTWLEHGEDNEELRRREKERRPELYEQFRYIVEHYLRDNRMTHQQFADLVGVSRQSLSKYLNGDAIPKISTMKRICKTINIDIQ